MDLDKIRVGMICSTHKGSGVVSMIDGASQVVYLNGVNDNHPMEAGIEDIIDDPQIHDHQDWYY
ncbi:hypothetical protein [Thalassotalea crassostreae]|uniref:hypothetical protein n=1 Tax=Thalassotalea crassostreae TaxID=1763536 RepID=UPI0008398204|nr:hypothetical protein [Thalassotalea crassostreae]